MYQKKALAIGIVAMMFMMAVSMSSVNAEGAANGPKALFDMGNGTTVWVDIPAGSSGTIDSVMLAAAAAAGISYSSSGGAITINGLKSTEIGGPDINGHSFAWDDPTGVSGNIKTLTVTSDETVDGTFTPNLPGTWTVTIVGAGRGGSYYYRTSDMGGYYLVSGAISVPNGSDVEIKAVPSTGCSFAWDDGTVGNTKILTNVVSDDLIIGAFTPVCAITVTGVGLGSSAGGTYQYRIGGTGGYTTLSDGVIYAPEGSTIEIRAVLNAGCSFTWDDLTGVSGNVKTLTVTSDETVSGTFTPPSGNRVITVGGAGMGGTYTYRIGGSGTFKAVSDGVIFVPNGSNVEIRGVSSTGCSFVWDDLTGVSGNTKTLTNVISDTAVSGTFTPFHAITVGGAGAGGSYQYRIIGISEFKAVSDGVIYAPEGSTVEIEGLPNTALIKGGTTGVYVKSEWHMFSWNDTQKKWVPVTNISTSYSNTSLAVGFYPLSADMVPVETPDHPNAWTMIRGNAEQTGEQEYTPASTDDVSVEWARSRGGQSGVYSSVLTVQGLVFVLFSHPGNTVQVSERNTALVCYDREGNEKWRFTYIGLGPYDSSTPVIAGDYIFVPSTSGQIYRMPWKDGPGAGDVNVLASDPIPLGIQALLTGGGYASKVGSLVFDSGCLFMECRDGMVYCMDTDLNLIWATLMGGSSYYFSPTVFDDYVAAGALNGSLYIMDKSDGHMIAEADVYTKMFQDRPYGSVAATVVIKTDDIPSRTDNGKYILMFSFNDGQGMDAEAGGIGIYEFDPGAATNILVEKHRNTGFGVASNYVQRVVNDDFQGIYFTTKNKELFRIDVAGNYKLLNDSLYSIKSPPTLVNGDSIFLVSYNAANQTIYQVGLDGKILTVYTPNPKDIPVNYNMSPIVIVDGMVFYGNDSGLIAISGAFHVYIEPVTPDKSFFDLSSPKFIALLILIIIAAAIAAMYVIMRRRGIEKPFTYLRGRMSHYVGGEDLLHNTKSKHRLLIMVLAGAVVTFAVAVLCLCIGATSVMSVGNMFSSLFSAISKGGSALTYDELMVYESRLPRTLMALVVGIGLSVAGCMYQAIIRNPLVDPYIMGVSAGAGTAAVAVIGLNFTLFGLFSPHSIYLTAVCAIVGGIVAFFVTMLLAEKAGGSSLNYVLAGVVIGLALSSIQSVMLSMAGHQVSNALGWLFGSFANVSWNHLRLVVFPVLALSLVPLFWAREFNLVLLGEDQARQMGLNVRRFSRSMLVIASALTALCVAFVGIIGFVGLVIPHVCRMILGGDHRLVLPASIAIGGALMMIADLASRTLYYGHELPVGAITTMIGVPVFAYLLIRRGKIYEG